MNCDVLIIGAGPTGMAAAIEAKRAGLSVRIVDKENHLALHSQALILQSRSLEQFQRYGIAERFVERGRKILQGHFYSDGKEILKFDFSRIPSRYDYLLFLPQSQTEALLEGHMQSLGVTAERNKELVSLADHGNTVEANLQAVGGAETVFARWVIGCDGAHSATRRLADIPFEGSGVGLSFFLGDLELEGPDVPDQELTVRLHKGNVVFMGRLDRRLTRLIVALHDKQDGTQTNALTTKDFQDALDQSNVRATVISSDWMTPFRVNDRQAKHYRKGNLFLAGDASHIHSPVGGQGMNTGLQDVANLVWKLAAVKRGADPKILDSYEEERGEVGRALLRFTSRGLSIATMQNPLLEGLRDLLLPVVTSTETLQNSLVRFLSETAIQYRTSSLTRDVHTDGALRAGDRMPDVLLRTTGSAHLLERWTEGGHLLVVLGMAAHLQEELKSILSDTETRVLAEEQLTDEAKRPLGSEPKVFLIRPDGYIAFRGPLGAMDQLRESARQNGLM